MPITILYYIVSLTNFLKYNIIKKKKNKEILIMSTFII